LRLPIGRRLRFKYSFHNLLLWLLLYLVLAPFLRHLPGTRIILSMFITVVLFSAVYTIEQHQRLFRVAVCLLALSLSLLWLDLLNILPLSGILDTAVIMVYIGIVLYAFMRHVFKARVVDTRLICAALCLYLFLGTFWGYLYEMIYLLEPGSFSGDLLNIDKDDPLMLRQHFQYFSFVTLTTLGYGDITPKAAGPASLCAVEAIMGQFFMTVLIARLVGIQVSQQFSKEGKEATSDGGEGGGSEAGPDGRVGRGRGGE